MTPIRRGEPEGALSFQYPATRKAATKAFVITSEGYLSYELAGKSVELHSGGCGPPPADGFCELTPDDVGLICSPDYNRLYQTATEIQELQK